jgi:predicted GIY-YIG superfamily endonuclease
MLEVNTIKAMQYHVYSLVENESIVYIGKTNNPKLRLWFHKSKTGKFKDRNVTLEIVDTFKTNKEALEYEKDLKIKNGFIWTEQNARIKGGLVTGQKNKQSGHLDKIRHLVVIKDSICPHCNKKGKSNAMVRWHFENCKNKL